MTSTESLVPETLAQLDRGHVHAVATDRPAPVVHGQRALVVTGRELGGLVVHGQLDVSKTLNRPGRVGRGVRERRHPTRTPISPLLGPDLIARRSTRACTDPRRPPAGRGPASPDTTHGQEREDAARRQGDGSSRPCPAGARASRASGARRGGSQAGIAASTSARTPPAARHCGSCGRSSRAGSRDRRRAGSVSSSSRSATIARRTRPRPSSSRSRPAVGSSVISIGRSSSVSANFTNGYSELARSMRCVDALRDLHRLEAVVGPQRAGRRRRPRPRSRAGRSAAPRRATRSRLSAGSPGCAAAADDLQAELGEPRVDAAAPAQLSVRPRGVDRLPEATRRRARSRARHHARVDAAVAPDLDAAPASAPACRRG